MHAPFLCRTRKFFTILASVVWFGHTLNSYQWLGCVPLFVPCFFTTVYDQSTYRVLFTSVVFVFSGLGIDILDKYHEKKAKHAAHLADMAKMDAANGVELTAKAHSKLQ